MNRKELAAFTKRGWSTRKIAEAKEVSQATVKFWLKKFGIKTMHLPFHVRPHLCEDCGDDNPNNFYKKRKSCCRRCFIARDLEIGRDKKRRVIEHLGGKCTRCGYNKCHGALELHHHADKSSDWTILRNFGWDRILKELKKCILLCANCHREVHWEEDWQRVSVSSRLDRLQRPVSLPKAPR